MKKIIGTVHCDCCGTPAPQLEDSILIYPCVHCGREFDMGSSAQPLTLEQWQAIEKRHMNTVEARRKAVRWAEDYLQKIRAIMKAALMG